MRQVAINQVADALSGSTGGVFASEEIPELVKGAAPFGLKLNEALLNEAPEHEGILLALASGYTQYAYAFLHFEADTIQAADFKRARVLKGQAKKLYLRSRGYAFRGLEVRYPGFEQELRTAADSVLANLTAEDLPFMYWLGMSWMGAISISMSDIPLLSEMVLAEKVMRRAFQLDPDYGDGSLHEFFITFEGSRPESMGGGKQKALDHYEQALKLNKGMKAGTHVSLATAVTVAEQDVDEFRRLLQMALDLDVDKYPQYRLENTLAQQRAAWLLKNIEHYFLLDETMLD